MKKTLARCGLATAATGAVALGLVGGPAASAEPDAGAAQGPAPAKIVMKFNGEKLFFAGAKEVVAGQPLKIVNTIKPRKHGPHTFSLTEESVIPRTRRAGERCFAPSKICLAIAVAHKFNPRTEKVNLPVVKAGKSGWDKMFTKDAKGDSWYTEKLGGSFSQKVTAEPGTTLHYMCAVHPQMQGKIDVVE
jgi:plastocyanin